MAACCTSAGLMPRMLATSSSNWMWIQACLCRQAPRARREHEAPGVRQDRAPQAGLDPHRHPVYPRTDTRDHQRRHLRDVLGEIGGGCGDPRLLRLVARVVEVQVGH